MNESFLFLKFIWVGLIRRRARLPITFRFLYFLSPFSLFHYFFNFKLLTFLLGKSSAPVAESANGAEAGSFTFEDGSLPYVSRPLRMLDVFAGCGGLSQGLHQVIYMIWAKLLILSTLDVGCITVRMQIICSSDTIISWLVSPNNL